MKRDFTETARQELLSLVDQVESEKWSNATDWIGDRFLDFSAWIGALDVQDYIDNVSSYHKKVIDKNNTTAAEINRIFEDVNGVSDLYGNRFAAHLADLREYKSMIRLLSATVAPGNGSFNPQFMEAVKNRLNRYLSTSENLQIIAANGLTAEQVKDMDENKLQDIMRTYGTLIMNNLPDVKLGSQIEIPIGPGVKMYYKVEGQVEGTGDIGLEYVLEDHKLQLQQHTFEIFPGLSAGVDQEGNVAVEGEAGGNGWKTDLSGGTFTFSREDNLGIYTYGTQVEMNLFKGDFSVEYSVSSELPQGSITSTLGVKYSGEDDWKPLPVPVPVESPYTCQLPQFDVDWETVGEIVIIAGVVYTVVKIGAAVVLAPATGGGSLVLVAV